MFEFSRRRFVQTAGLATAAKLVGLPSSALAQSYPDRAVRLVVGFTASPPDTIARLIGQRLSVQMGQPFVIENKLGANGILGADSVAKAAPDGYTLLVTSASHAVNPSIYKKMPFDPANDLVPITNIAQNDGLLLVTTRDLPAESVRELIAYAKRPDAKFSYGSPGIGNTLHLSAGLFAKLAGIEALHVTYRGAAPAITDLIAGQIQMMFLPPSAGLELVREKKLKALAYTDTRRLAALPDVPTMAEAGMTAFDFGGAGWYGMFAPAKTPSNIVDRLFREVRTAVQTDEMRQRFAQLGLEPVLNSPEEFRREYERSVKRFGEITSLLGVEPQ